MGDQRSTKFAMFMVTAVTLVAGTIAYILTIWVQLPLVEAGMVPAVNVEHSARSIAVVIGGTILLIGSVLAYLKHGER